MIKKVKNTIPVYDIQSIGGVNQLPQVLIAERFAPYLLVHPNLHDAHKHDFYHIVLFTKGAGMHTIDFERFKVAPGQVYFMIPGQVHSWSFEGEVDGYILNFSATLLTSFLLDQQYLERFSFFKGIATDSVLNLPADVATTAATIMQQMIDEVQSKDALHHDMIGSLLTRLLVHIHRSIAGDAPDDLPRHNGLLLSKFRSLVEQHYTTMHLPKEYAAMLYITPNYLNSMCKDMLGKPAGQLIRERILLEAKRLLVNAGLNIDAIAQQLNFTDNSYFTKFFKKYTGITPEAFRKQSLHNSTK